VANGVQPQRGGGESGAPTSSSPSSLGGLGSSGDLGGCRWQPVQVADPAIVAEVQLGLASAFVTAPLVADAFAGAATTAASAARTTAPRIDPLTRRLPSENVC
jgi:hypothetical protein